MPMPRLTGPLSRARGPALAPAEPLGADAPLLARGASAVIRPGDVDLVAQRERIHAEPLRQLVDGLLQARRCPATWPGARKAAQGPALVKTSYCSDADVRAGVERGVGEADARAARHAAAAVGSRAGWRSSVPSRLRAELEAAGCCSGGCRTDTCSSRRSSISRTGAPALRERWMASSPKLPMPNLAPKPPPSELADDADLALGQVEDLGGSSRTLPMHWVEA